MNHRYTLARLLEILGDRYQLAGAYEGLIHGIASLEQAQPGDLSFLGNPKYRTQVPQSRASVILVPEAYEGEAAEGQLLIRLENPSYALALVCRDIEGTLLPRPPAGIHPSAVIEDGAEISPQASVGAFCYVGAGARIGAAVLRSHVSVGCSAEIGDESQLFPHVWVGDHCEVGRRNRLLAGCVLGADGYEELGTCFRN